MRKSSLAVFVVAPQLLCAAVSAQIVHHASLSWTASVSPNVVGYNIYRGTTSGGPYTLLNSPPVALTSYLDASVLAGSTYYYVATAVDSTHNESVYSNEVQAVIPNDFSRPMLNPQVEPTNIFLQYFQGTDPTQVTASFTISTSDNSGFSIRPVPLSWLILSTRSGAVTPAAIRVGINPAGLAPGTYPTVETVTFFDNTQIAVNITLQVVGLPNLSTDLPTGVTGLTFTAPAGSTTVQSQSLRIFSSIRGVTADVTTSGEAWLGANPSPGIARLVPLGRVAAPKNAGLVAGASASTPFTLRATANPTGLAAGKYTATITLTSAQAGNSPFTIPVTFNIAAPPQSIAVNAVVNAASLLSNSAAPYTIVTAFGTFPGCTSGAQVSVNGSSVLVFYSSTTQINFLLPSSLGTALSASIQVSCAGLTAASVTVPLAPYAPAIITTTQDGKGQAEIINQDHTMETPAPIGSVIEVYSTGFGVLGPKGSDGLSRTMLPVTAFVGDVPATVTYAGEAPTWQGLQQINVQIPAGAPHGAAVSLRLVINGIGTQPGVTIAVP